MSVDCLKTMLDEIARLSLLSLFFLVGVIGQESQASECKNMAGVEASRSLKSTLASHHLAEKVEYSTHRNWSTKEMNRNLGKVFNFEDFRSEILPQEILGLSDFTPRDRKLIKKLWTISSNNKFRRKAYRNSFDEELTKLQAEIKVLDFAKKRARENINLYRSSESVEVGLFRLMFKDGSYKSIIHTSSSKYSIEQEQISAAMTAAFGRRELSEVKLVQYFHTHPNEGGVLSKTDLNFTEHAAKYFRAEGLDGPFHIYAITQYSKKFFIYHSDY